MGKECDVPEPDAHKAPEFDNGFGTEDKEEKCGNEYVEDQCFIAEIRA